MVVPLEQSEAWIGLYTEAVDVSETLAGKLFGARRAKGLSRFLETHLLALLFIRAAFYVSVALYLPWLARIVTDAAFFSTVPLGMLWALYLYSSAHVPTLRALLTSFDVVYIMLLATSGTVALCDILRYVELGEKRSANFAKVQNAPTLTHRTLHSSSFTDGIRCARGRPSASCSPSQPSLACSGTLSRSHVVSFQLREESLRPSLASSSF